MDDSEDATAAMAAAMGFSSFGAQQPNKRRKFNPSTDAFVAPESPSASTSASGPHFHEHANNRMKFTGANTIPLGVRKKNVGEIDLGDDEDEGHLPPGSEEPQQAAVGNDNHDEDDPEPQYLDTSRPSAPIAANPADSLQSQIDAIVGRSADARAFLQLPSSVVGDGESSRGDYRGPQRNIDRDDRSGTKWWENYYDPSFIVNPWEQLEKAHGLEPRGDWVSWEEAKRART
ncbi:hypothetical protein F4859DRAFT_303345 [Xylaria cf. heliscus]|nr:hypothetical protein F4859DRAFT_303345 [Xylaria cf. heliscus]